MSRSSELSSVTASLEELSARVTALADDAQARADEEAAATLFAVERSLTGALRRLRRLASESR